MALVPVLVVLLVVVLVAGGGGSTGGGEQFLADNSVFLNSQNSLNLDLAAAAPSAII